MTKNAIEIAGLKKTYSSGVQALKGVDLTVEAGDFFALLGANGAGKTTAIGIMTSLVNRTDGDVKIFGIDTVKHPNKAKRMIGVVPQEFNFNIFEKVQDIAVQQAGFFGIPKKQALKNLEPILKILDLWEKRNEQAQNLSGGMKRRLMIARALVHKPKLLILDEPTAGVDVELRRGMWDYMRKLNKEEGMTILLTTHYIEEAEELCKNVAIIKDGEIVTNSSVKKLLQSMERHIYIAQLSEVKKDLDLGAFKFEKLDEMRIEVTVERGQNLNDLVKHLDKKGITLLDLNPKGNKLEQLFLNILNK